MMSARTLFRALPLLALALSPSITFAQGARSGRVVIMGGGGFGARPDVYRAILEARQGTGPICVIPTASAEPQGSIESAVEAFDTHGGAGSAVGVPQLVVDNPRSASDPAVVQALSGCSGYYFVGGVQSRIVTVMRPEGRSTPALDVVLRRFREGAVVSGSSAGAAVMSDPMIAGGASGAMAGGVRRSTGAPAAADAPEQPDGALDLVSIEPGIGFFPAALVDQHFLARGRFGRLLVAVLDMPEFDLGFGVDESTALVVEGGAAWPVGASGVVVIDEAQANTSGGASTGVRVHLMSAGDRFDLASRTVTPATAKKELPAGPAVTAPENLFARWSFFQLLDGFARSSQSELTVPVPSGRVVIRKSPTFLARGSDGAGVEGTTAGLTVGGLIVELHRAR